MLQKVKRLFDSESKTLAKNSSWLMLSTVFQAVVVFLKTVIIARELGVEVYGVYAIILAFVATIQEVFNVNFGAAMIKFSADFSAANQREKILAMIKLGYVVAFLSALLSILFIWLVSLLFYEVFFESEGYQSVIMIFSIAASFALINAVPQVILRIYDKYKISSFVRIAMYTIEIVSIWLFFQLSNGSIFGLVTLLAIVAVFNALLCNGSALFEVRNDIAGWFSQSMTPLISHKSELVGFVVNNSLSKTVQKLLKKGDVLLLASFAGDSAVAVYDVARKLAFSLLVIKDPLIMAVYPQLASLISSGKKQAIKRFIATVTTFATIMYLIGAVSVALLGSHVINLIFGPEYTEATQPLFFLVCAVGLEISLFYTVPYVLSLGETKFRLKMSLISAFTMVGTSLLLAPNYGAIGVAIGVLLSSVLLQVGFGFMIAGHMFSRSEK